MKLTQTQLLAILKPLDTHKAIDWRKLSNGKLVRFTDWGKAVAK